MTPRFEICRECGLDWNVSINAKIPYNGYLCPACRGKQKKEAQTRENGTKKNTGARNGRHCRNT